MKDCLKPHRNLEAEEQLKILIQKIQSLMDDPKNYSVIEQMLQQASVFIKAPDRVLDLIVIEQYDEWTDLDGLVGELTMEVPVLQDISKEDFLSIVQWIRTVIKSGKEPENMRLDYMTDFYRNFFILNFPQIKDIDDLFDKLFEDVSLDELINLAFSRE